MFTFSRFNASESFQNQTFPSPYLYHLLSRFLSIRYVISISNLSKNFPGYIIRDLESYTETQFSQELTVWLDGSFAPATNYWTDCGSLYLLGGDGYAANSYTFQRTYDNLPTHQSIIVSFEVYMIDPAAGATNSFSVGAATPLFELAAALSLTNNLCGTAANDLVAATIYVVAQHTEPTLTFNFPVSGDNTGIRNIKILLGVNPISTPSSCALTDSPSVFQSGGCSCFLGQYSASGTCTPCDSACKGCYAGGASGCYSCQNDYSFDGTTCYKCDESCETCSGPGSSACLTCPWGDPADANSQCILVCDEACSTCTGTTPNTCSACNDGYYFDGSSSCLECDSSCKTCSAAGPNACLICPSGDPADANSQCLVPPPPETPEPLPLKGSTKQITEIKTATQSIVGAGLIANTIARSGSSSAIRMSMLAQMIDYLKYLDIDYPYDVRYALSTWDGDFINFNSDDLDLTPNSLENYGSSYGPLPSPITMYDYDIDSSFLMNFWDQLIPLFILSGLLIFMVIFEVIASKTAQGEVPKKIFRQLKICIQWLLITFLYNDFDDIFFFAILSSRTTRKGTVLTVTNIIASILFIFLTVGALIGQTWLVKKYQTLKNKEFQEEFEKFKSKIEGVKILWKDFKDESFLQMNALLFTVMHNILFCIILATLTEHPLVQVILINILSVAIIIFVVRFQPYNEKLELFQTIACEVILLAVNICLLILILLDSNSNSRESVGEVLLALTLVFNFVSLVCLVITAIVIMNKAYHAVKAYLLKRKLEKLKNSGVHLKKTQVVPIIIEPSKDNASIGNPSLMSMNSSGLAQRESVGMNLLLADSGYQGNRLHSPTASLMLHLEGASDHDDQLLKAGDIEDSSLSKFSRGSLIGNRQQNLLRNQREYLKSRKSNKELELEDGLQGISHDR